MISVESFNRLIKLILHHHFWTAHFWMISNFANRIYLRIWSAQANLHAVFLLPFGFAHQLHNMLVGSFYDLWRPPLLSSVQCIFPFHCNWSSWISEGRYSVATFTVLSSRRILSISHIHVIPPVAGFLFFLGVVLFHSNGFLFFLGMDSYSFQWRRFLLHFKVEDSF